MDTIPTHIAIIPDGNRRWAKANGLSTFRGHRAGFDRSYELVRAAGNKGVKIVTFWGFSTENWKRSPIEVAYLLKLFASFTRKWIKEAKKEGVQLRFIGNLTKFPPDLRKLFRLAIEDTKHNSKIIVNIALNYGGRDEIKRAIKKLLNRGQQTVTDKDVEQALDTQGLDDPDLIIRTSGEQRLSGFMPWQTVYSELYFAQVHFPDFSTKELDKALSWYANRQRRFGK